MFRVRGHLSESLNLPSTIAGTFFMGFISVQTKKQGKRYFQELKLVHIIELAYLEIQEIIAAVLKGLF